MGLEVEVIGETNKFDVICIGGGIAGMTASASLTQLGLKSCFLEKEVPGGKLMHVEQIHNLEGYEGVNGASFATNYFEHVLNEIKTKYNFGNVLSMKSKNDKFYLWTEDGQAWETKALIISTGTVIKRLNLPSEEKFINKGLSYCVLCDASLASNKKVVLIGNKSHLAHLQKFTNNIEFVNPSDVKDYVGSDKIEGILKTDGTTIKCDMVFVENGFESSLDFLIPEVKRNERNEIVVDNDMKTSFPGIFSCGDCTTGIKQISNAIFQAQTAAASVEKYIKSRKW